LYGPLLIADVDQVTRRCWVRFSWSSERGAALVEIAIIMPILLMLVLGVVEFGRAYNTNISVTHAAREGIRAYTITRGSDDAAAATLAGTAAAQNAATSIDPADLSIVFTDCAPGDQARVVVTRNDFDFLIPFVPLPTIDISEQGVMRCGG
jgi:Flp pilus assembly protein TadG